MQQTRNLQHMVPTAVVNRIEPTIASRELIEALGAWHSAMSCISNVDTALLTASQLKIVEELAKCKDQVLADTGTVSGLNKQALFELLFLAFTGRITWASEFLPFTNDLGIQVAIYFGCIGAKAVAELAKAPAGFNTTEMFSILKNLYYETAVRPVGAVSKPAPPVGSSTRSHPTQSVSIYSEASATGETPEFAEDEDLVITTESRRRAQKLAVKLISPDGPFSGLGDKRSIRTFLKRLKEDSMNNFYSSVEYHAVLEANLTEEVRRVALGTPCRTHGELSRDISRRIHELVITFGLSPRAERLQLRKSFQLIRQQADESLLQFIFKFDKIVFDLKAQFDQTNDDDLVERFTQALLPTNQERAIVLTLARPAIGYQELRTQLLAIDKGRDASRLQATSAPKADSRSGVPDPRHKKLDSAMPQSGQCKKCNRNHATVDCRLPAETTCNGCGQKGHILAACTLPTSPNASSKPLYKSPTSDPYKTKGSYSMELSSAELEFTNDEVEVSNTDHVEDTQVLPHLDCNLAGKPISLLLDCGAPCGMISQSLFDELQHKGEVRNAKRCTIKCANGATTSSSKEIVLPLSYEKNGLEVTKLITFRLYPPLHRAAILGIDAMAVIGLTLRFGNDDLVDPVHLEVLNCDKLPSLPLPSNDDDTLYPPMMAPERSDARIRKHLADYLHDDASPSATSLSRDFASLTLTDIKTIANDLLDKCVQAGPMPFADGYVVSLERCPPGMDMKDIPDQQFYFLISWTLTDEAEKVNSWNSQPMIDKLTIRHATEWNEHIQTYVEKQWWSESKQFGPLAATVFPVTQADEKTTTVRPCSDFRKLNACSPPISAVTTSVSEAVWKLRSVLKSTDQVCQYDLSKAFYKIHVHISKPDRKLHELHLRVGKIGYKSSRLVFGLSCGPASLNITQSIIDVVAQRLYQIADQFFTPPTTIVVVDDYLIVGNERINAFTTVVLDTLWNLTGFDCPPKKRSVWSESPTRWLGGDWTWSNGKLLFNRPIIAWPVRNHLTKRTVFQDAGQVTAISNSYHEALARGHCDAARSISGKSPEWDIPITPGPNTKDIQTHLDLARKHYDLSRDTEQDLPLLHGLENLVLLTDASQCGHGFVLTCAASGRIVYAQGKLFKVKEFPWHVNRKELYSLAIAIQRLDVLLGTLPNVRSICCRSDSKVALAHANAYKEIPSKSLDRRVLLRLRSGILDILSFWKRNDINFRIEHIKGEDNVFADALSRISSKTLEEHEINSTTLIEQSFTDRMSPILYFVPYSAWLFNVKILTAWANSTGKRKCKDFDHNIRGFFKCQQANSSQCLTLNNKLGTSAADPETRFLFLSPDGILFRRIDNREQVYVPNHLLHELILHVHVGQGHVGFVDTLTSFNEFGFNPASRQTVKRVLRACDGCTFASGKCGQATVFGPVKRPTHIFQILGLDLYGPLSRRSGRPTGNYVLTIVDKLSGYTQFLVIPDCKASSVCRSFEHFLLLLGQRVTTVVTDNGTQFVASSEFASLLAMWNIHHQRIPIYTPSAGGFYECKHKIVSHVIRSLLQLYPLSNWQLLASIASQRLNSKIADDRSSSPHALVFGYEYVWPFMGTLSIQSSPIDSNSGLDDPFLYAHAETEANERQAFRKKILRLWDDEFEKRRQDSAKRFLESIPSNRLPLQSGDRVVFAKDIIKKKFAPQCEGPFILIEQLGQQTWRTQEIATKKEFVLHARRLRKFDSFDTSVYELPIVPDYTLSSPSDSPPPLEPVIDLVGSRARPFSNEEKILRKIDGLSRSGRLRRGSLLVFLTNPFHNGLCQFYAK